MKTIKKRIPALLMALVLLASLAAVPAGAAESKTYTVSANLFCPGELNTQLPGVTAYLTNGSNPLGIDGYPAEPPVTPMKDNATLTVAADGKITVKVPIKNPVFTLQSISGCSNAKIVSAPKDDRLYEAVDGSGSRKGRITSLTVELLDKSGSYVFTSCKEYPTLLSAEWTVPLTLQVDLSGTDLGEPGQKPAQPVAPSKPAGKVNTDGLKATISAAEKAVGAAVVSKDGTDIEPSRVWVPKAAVETMKSEIGKAKASLAAVDQSSVDRANEQLKAALNKFRKAEQSGKKQAEEQKKPSGKTLKAGSYTVTCNVWFNKADTGLPLNPHITNPTFPPYNPVLDNAKLVIDKEGRGVVTVPVTIQDKIMLVKKLEGLSFRNIKMGESGGIASFDVDLGTVDAGSTVLTKSCVADIEMGDLAMSISGLDKPHTWPATFELNLSGVPCADGSVMPTVEVAMMNADEASEAMAGAGTALPEEDSAEEESEEEEQAEETEEEESGNETSGGSGAAAVVIVLLILAAAAGAVVVVKKRKR